MEPDTQAGAPRRLGDFLRARHDQIIALWEAEVRRLRPARALSRPMLLDHIPDFLRQLGAYVDEVREGHQALPPQEFPVIHAIERLDLGYDVTEVVAEYSILRRCIIDTAARDGTPSVRSLQMPRLHEAIDQAIAASLNRYAQARERTLKALDRMSTAALAEHDADTFLPRMLAVLLETTAAVDAVSVLLIEGEVLRVRASVGLAMQPEEAPPLRPGECFAGRVWQARQPMLTRDAENDPAIVTDIIRKRGMRALYGVPLQFGERTIGVAMMGSCSTWEFSHEDLLLFRTAATRAAALVAHARLDAEVKQQHRLYGALLQAQSDVGEGFLLVEDDSVAYANDALARMLGSTPAQVVGRPAIELVVPEDREALLRRREAAAASGEVQEVRLQHRDGHAIDVEASVKKLDPRRRVAICRDITVRKRAERELQRGIEYRDRIMGVLSHDLRQPLAVITTSASRLLMAKDLDQYAPVVQRQLRAAQRMDRMIRDLLDYSRTRHGELAIAPREVDAAELLRQSVDSVQAIEEREFRLATEGDCRGAWDGDRLLQVFGNLLGNAAAYSPPGTPIDVSLRGEPEQVTCAVHNGGAPIPPDKLPTIFEAFRRASTESNAEGLGLGLYIVRKIVSAHGGTVDVESTGAGTTFTVRLPRKPPA